MRVSGPPLPLPVMVRIDRADDGRFMVTGLLIGLRDRREITWETLRLIKPASIVAWIFSGFDGKRPLDEVRATDPSPPRLVGTDFDLDEWLESDDDAVIMTGSNEDYAYKRAQVAFNLWQSTTFESPTRLPEPATKPRASVAADLTAFAETYSRNYAANPRRATTSTAEQMHISRATAIRRIAECREVGLLPGRAEEV